MAEVYKKVWCPANEVSKLLTFGVVHLHEVLFILNPVNEALKVIQLMDYFPPKGEPMRIIYRMRGLLGDATEEFIESLDSTTG